MLHAIGDHLWQSTLVAFLAAGLAWTLRKHAARLRYWVWLGASLKFLLPFALLAALGNELSFRVATPEPRDGSDWQAVAVQLVQPLTARRDAESVVPPAGAPDAARQLADVSGAEAARDLSGPESATSTRWRGVIAAIGVIAVVVWVLGSLFLAGVWVRRWLSLTRLERDARPFAALAIASHRLDIRVTASSIEPGVFGILRPVLLIPEGIVSQLTPAQLEAIVSHERFHVLRRDNLTASLHMLVEILFWFHPIVWWMGARLIEERERACDEAVVRDNADPDVYASAIVDVCDLYRKSPLHCAAGVGGGSLEDRVRRIVDGCTERDAGGVLKALLMACVFALVGMPIAFGVIHSDAAVAQPAAPVLPAPEQPATQRAVAQEPAPQQSAPAQASDVRANVWAPLPGPPPLVVGFGRGGSFSGPTGTRYTMTFAQCMVDESDTEAGTDADAGTDIGPLPAMESFEDLVLYAYELEPDGLVWQASTQIPGVRVMESQFQSGMMLVLTPPPLARHDECRSMLRNSLETGYGLKTHRDGDRFVVDSIDVPPVPDPPAPRPLAAWEPVSEPVSDREYGLFLGRAWVDGADRYWQLWVTLRGCTDVADAAAVAGSTDAGPLPRLSSIGDIVRYAHDLQSHEIVWPAGVEDVAIDVVSSSGQRTGVVNHSQCQTFLRQALANEVDLQAHFETGSSDLWYLRVDEGGTNLNLARTGTIERATGERVDRHVWSRPNAIYGSAASMPRLAAYLSNRLRTPVIDETGLTQLYDFSFVWQPAPADSTDPEQVEFEAMRAAMLRWWGLVLVPGEAELRRFIVDNVEFPELPDELPRTF